MLHVYLVTYDLNSADLSISCFCHNMTQWYISRIYKENLIQKIFNIPWIKALCILIKKIVVTRKIEPKFHLNKQVVLAYIIDL